MDEFKNVTVPKLVGTVSRKPAFGTRELLWLSVTLVLILAALTGFFCWSEIRRSGQEETMRLGMLARMMEDDAHRTLDFANAALQTVARRVAALPPKESPESLDAVLEQTLTGISGVRAISVVDVAQRRIVASTQSDDAGRTISQSRMDRLSPRNQSPLGELMPGRSLADSQLLPDSRDFVGFVPLAARRLSGSGRDYLVVVQVDPKAFSSYQRRLLEENEASIRSSLLTLQGQTLAQSYLSTQDGNEKLRNVELVEQLRKHDQYNFEDDSASHDLVVLRFSREYPIVTVVREPRSAVVTGAFDNLHWLGYLAPLTLAVVVILTGVAARSMHRQTATYNRLKQAEDQLKRQLKLTEHVQEIAPVALCMTDPEGRFLMVNRAWEVFMGRQRSEVLGRRSVDFLGAAEAAVYDRHDERLLATGGELHFEDVIHHDDGKVGHVQVHKAAVLDDEGKLLGLLATRLDVTDFRQAQGQAESASRSKSEFVANISHELRTPLQSILGFSELGMLRSSVQPKLQGLFQDVHESGMRMLSLVNDLLDVSKIESTVGTFDFQSTDLRSCVSSVTHELEPLLARKRLELKLDQTRQALPVHVDEIRIRQVIRNVLANAIKFTPEASCIHVVTNVVTSLESGGHQVLVSVRDQGPGIPEQESEAVFEPFVQSSRTQQVNGGTGLGLAISRKILDAHGGSIRTYNAAMGGAVFEISLPLEMSEATA